MRFPEPGQRIRDFDPEYLELVAQKLNNDRQVGDYDMNLRLPTWAIMNFEEADRMALVSHGMEDVNVFRRSPAIPGRGRSEALCIQRNDDD